jgi:hypothetical protein
MNPAREFRIGAWATPPRVIDPAIRKISDDDPAGNVRFADAS